MLLIAPLAAPIMSGCQTGENASSSSKSKESPLIKSQDGRACLALVNGQLDTQGTYEAVVVLTTKGRSLCTGTFVSDNTVITAAHCINSAEEGGGLRANVADKFIEPLFSLVPEIPAKTDRGVKDDLAVVVFPDNTAQTWASLSRFSPKIGQRITIVGVGQTDFLNDSRPDGKRRFGQNTISGFGVDGTEIQYEVPINEKTREITNADAITGRGDSGGPLFLGNGLIGVVSRGNLEPENGKLKEFDTNLFTAKIESFLQNATKEGAKINGLANLTRAITKGGEGPLSDCP